MRNSTNSVHKFKNFIFFGLKNFFRNALKESTLTLWMYIDTETGPRAMISAWIRSFWR